MRIAVVQGGRSLEREISLRSGHHVADALRHLGHDAIETDVDAGLAAALQGSDAAFVALHGRDGEDGTVQWIAEALGVAYTGSDPTACQLCFDKSVAKRLLSRAALSTPEAYVISEDAIRHMGAGAAMRSGAERIGYPLVVKPAAQGSALGLTVVHQSSELAGAVRSAFDYGGRVLMERLVRGRELTISVLGAPLEPLPPVEIKTSGEVFDFKARPTVSPGAAQYLCPAELEPTELELVSSVALQACAILGVRDFARVDLILTAKAPFVLDVKTCPGLTETSLLPLAAAQAGIGFQQFVDDVLGRALERRAG